MRKYLFLFCLLFVIIFSGCNKSTETHKDNELVSQNTITQEKVNTNNDSSQIEKQVKKTEKETILERIKNSDIDESFCNSLKNEKYKKMCFTELKEKEYRAKLFQLEEKGEKMLDYSYCNNLEREDDIKKCKADIAQTKIMNHIATKQDCSYLLDKNLQQDCVKQVFMRKIIKSKDISLCNKFQDPEKGECEYKVFNSLSTGDINEKVCDQITDNMLKQTCINKLIKLKGSNLKTCELVKDDQMKYSNCVNNYVMEQAKKGINKCDLLKDDDMLYKECLFTYAISYGVKNQTVKDCKYFKDDNMQLEKCENTIVNKLNKQENTKKYCDLFSYPLWKVQCKAGNN